MKRMLCVGLAGCLLSTEPALAAMKSIARDRVNIRSAPSREAEVVFKAPLGYPIKVEREKGQWVFFRDWENDTGWVYKPLVSNVQTAVILAGNANVRQSPGTGKKIVAQAAKGEIYKVVDSNGKWVKIAYFYGGGVVGWIRGDLVFGD